MQEKNTIYIFIVSNFFGPDEILPIYPSLSLQYATIKRNLKIHRTIKYGIWVVKYGDGWLLVRLLATVAFWV
jgi:hypothetical protein